MHLNFLVSTVIVIILGALGGHTAAYLHFPMPFLMGSLLTGATVAYLFGHRFPPDYKFPQKLREPFLMVIGVMIGSQVNSALLDLGPAILLSFLALTLFVPLALAGNVALFERFGADRTTAFFSGTPGGLIESITMAEERHADLPAVMAQQFLRIICVIVIVPVGLSLWIGHPVGSAGGMSLSRGDVDWSKVPFALGIGLIGLWAGHRLRFPAAVLTGPLLFSALVTVLDIFPINLPQWLVNDAQIIVGASLGMRFRGMFGRKLIRALGLAFLSVVWMLCLGALLAFCLTLITGIEFDVLLVGFAPGGVTEMALIALSLAANPAFVTGMHVYRIILTVILMGWATKRGVLPPQN